ncbi:MAG: hypothetical protein WD200_03965 [Candidatus Andersenbacteria bacterium]
MKLIVALTTPQEVMTQCIGLSRQLATQYDTLFVVGEETNHPHIPVCSLEIANDRISDVLYLVEWLTTVSSRPQCSARPIEAHEGYVAVPLTCSQELLCFRDFMVQALKPLRPSMTEEHPEVMEIYAPCLTITRLRLEKQAEGAVRTVHWKGDEFTVRSCGVYTAGEHGTCMDRLAEYDFRPY